jgi:hypothetical protein
MNTTFVVITIIVLRIVVPVLLTVLLAYLGYRLDRRWQGQAARAPKEIIGVEEIQEVEHSAHI